MFSPDPVKRSFQDIDFPFPISLEQNAKKHKKSNSQKHSRLVIHKPLDAFPMDEDIMPLSLIDKGKKITVIFSPLKESSLGNSPQKDPIAALSKNMVVNPSKNPIPSSHIVKKLEFSPKKPKAEIKKSEPEIVTEHAALRVSLIYQALVVYWQKAVRSDGTCRDFHVSVRSSDLQLGQAHERQHHAAHAFPASGIVDNLWNKMIMEKQIEGKVTPRKEMILEALHDAHNKMQQQLIEPENLISPLAEGIKRALWTGTPVSIAVNRTTIVRTDVNLVVDKRLEAETRPEFIPQLIVDSAQGKTEPHVLTKMFVDKARSHFETKIEEYKNSITRIQNKIDTGGKADIAYYERLIVLTEAAHKGTVEPKYEEIFGKIDPVSMQKVMLTGEELFNRSLKVLKQYRPEKH